MRSGTKTIIGACCMNHVHGSTGPADHERNFWQKLKDSTLTSCFGKPNTDMSKGEFRFMQQAHSTEKRSHSSEWVVRPFYFASNLKSYQMSIEA